MKKTNLGPSSRALPMNKQKVLVVGGGGFIGRHVIARLLAADAEVSILDKSVPDEMLSRLNCSIGSVSDSTLVAASVAGHDSVIYLAANSLPGSGFAGLSSEIHDHVEVAVRAAEISAAAGVKRFVFAGSGGTAYGYGGEIALREDMPTAPINAYGVSKLAIEHYLRLISRSRGMATTTLRISNPYGEGQNARRGQGVIAAAMEHALKGKTMQIWGDGSVARDFIHVADVAEAFAAACSVPNPPDLVNIGSGEATSLLTIIRKVEKATESTISVEFEPSRSVDVQVNKLDISLANETLGWSPNVSLPEGLARTARWWQDNM